MPRSKFSNYRNAVRNILINYYKWPGSIAASWVRTTENKEVLRTIYYSRLSAPEAARVVNSRVRVRKNKKPKTEVKS